MSIETNDCDVRSSGVAAAQSAPTHGPKLHWYAAYTCAQHEKSIARQLDLRSIESFLPLYERVSRRKDRRVKLQLPLFSGYIFVRMSLDEKLRVLQIPGVVRLVGFNGCPMPLSDEEIEGLRRGLDSKLRLEPHTFVHLGRRVCVKSGPLQGMQGILVKKRNNYRFVLSLESIRRSVAVEVDVRDLATV